jgi:hypothetical protein
MKKGSDPADILQGYLKNWKAQGEIFIDKRGEYTYNTYEDINMQQANLKEIKLKLPQNVVESLAKNEIVSLLLDKAFNKTEYYLTLSREMQQRYGMDFNHFKKKVEENKEEVFEEWDDLMEWEAYELAYKEWKTKYEELKNCMVS